RVCVRRHSWLRAGMGFREFCSDRRHFDDRTRLARYVDPLVGSPRRTDGMLRYLGGLTWDEVDSLSRRHAGLKMPVLFLWGEDDRTFPVDRAEPMVRQLGGPTRFVRIPHAS